MGYLTRMENLELAPPRSAFRSSAMCILWLDCRSQIAGGFPKRMLWWVMKEIVRTIKFSRQEPPGLLPTCLPACLPAEWPLHALLNDHTAWVIFVVVVDAKIFSTTIDKILSYTRSSPLLPSLPYLLPRSLPCNARILDASILSQLYSIGISGYTTRHGSFFASSSRSTTASKSHYRYGSGKAYTFSLSFISRSRGVLSFIFFSLARERESNGIERSHKRLLCSLQRFLSFEMLLDGIIFWGRDHWEQAVGRDNNNNPRNSIIRAKKG